MIQGNGKENGKVQSFGGKITWLGSGVEGLGSGCQGVGLRVFRSGFSQTL